jgi:uncharacterized protein YdaL
MKILSPTQLIPEKTYYIYGFGGSINMETTLRKKFIRLSENGEPVFFNKSFGDVIYNSNIWMFTQTLI